MNESIETFGPGLVGLYTPPVGGAQAKPGVVMINSGLIHRVGPSRLYVRIARQLAAAGHPVLRFDLSGVGDSPVRGDDLPFEESAPLEVSQAMDRLVERAGARPLLLFGLCSGALVAFKTALADERVSGALMINAPGFEDEVPAAILQYLERRQEARYYARVAFFRPGSWLKAIKRNVNLIAVLRVLSREIMRRVTRATPTLEGQSPVPAEFQRLVERGVKCHLVYSYGDWGLDYLRAVLGDREEALTRSGRFRLEVIEAADHVFTLMHSQQRLQELVVSWVAEA